MHSSLKDLRKKTIPISLIASFRVIFLSFYLVRILQTFRADLYDLGHRNPYNPIPLFEHFHIGRMGTDTFTGLSIVLVLSLLFAIEGRWARLALPLITAASFLRIGTSLGYYKAAGNPYVPHSQNILMLFLMLLTITPGAFHMPFIAALKDIYLQLNTRKPAATTAPLLYLLPFKLVLCVSYFGAAVVRLRTNGLGWMDGFTLQGYLYDRYSLMDLPAALILAKKHYLCQFLSIILNTFELTLFVTCLSSTAFLLGSFVAISIHLLILYFMGINFLTWHLLNFSIVAPELLLMIIIWKRK